jgi:hypothetical protein
MRKRPRDRRNELQVRAVRTFSAVTAVHAADALAHEIDESQPTSDPTRLDLEYLRQLDLEPRVKVWLKALAANGPSERPAI